MYLTYGCRPLWIVKFCWVLIVLWIMAVDVLNVQAQSQELPEYAVKAAFIYKFTKFVDWPAQAFADPKEPFSICVLGKDPFGNVLDQIFSGKTVNGREPVVKRSNSVEELKRCHILFISSSEKKRLARIIEVIKFAGILTIGDMDQFAESGGIIGLNEQDKKINIEINVDAVKRSDLKISSKLLIIGKTVSDGTAR